jgi:hypothetical protein
MRISFDFDGTLDDDFDGYQQTKEGNTIISNKIC